MRHWTYYLGKTIEATAPRKDYTPEHLPRLKRVPAAQVDNFTRKFWQIAEKQRSH
jgi:hypothetical protein